MTDLLIKDYILISDVKNMNFSKLYSHLDSLNAVQSYVFDVVYKTDENVIIGAPTGSGKTYAAEFALLRLFETTQKQKAIYIAPLKALTQERYNDWKERFDNLLGYRVEELTGDVNPDKLVIESSSIIITTPEKWDGITR